MNEKFELETSNSETREAINLVNETTDFESLAQLAYDNKVVGGKFNSLRYEFLKMLGDKFKGGVEFVSLYPTYNTETGMLTDTEENEVYITQVHDEKTDEVFFREYRQTIIDFLSLTDGDFEEVEEDEV